MDLSSWQSSSQRKKTSSSPSSNSSIYCTAVLSWVPWVDFPGEPISPLLHSVLPLFPSVASSLFPLCSSIKTTLSLIPLPATIVSGTGCPLLIIMSWCVLCFAKKDSAVFVQQLHCYYYCCPSPILLSALHFVKDIMCTFLARTAVAKEEVHIVAVSVFAETALGGLLGWGIVRISRRPLHYTRCFNASFAQVNRWWLVFYHQQLRVSPSSSLAKSLKPYFYSNNNYITLL